jgi:hypothetical protein
MRRSQAVTMVLALIAPLVLGAAASGDIPDLEGGWVMLQVYPQIATMPLAGEVAQASYVVQFVSIDQDAETLTMHDSYCFTVVDSGTPLVRTEIPAAFMASLVPSPRTAIITEQDGALVFTQSPYVEVRGAHLKDIGSDDLPVSSEDPRVFDQDEDGKPGMSISVSILGIVMGQTYVVQRVRYTLNGIVISPDWIEGTIDWSDEQNILGVSNPFLDVDASSSPDPDPSKHRFIMIRARDDWTCEWLQEHWGQVFGVQPEHSDR